MEKPIEFLTHIPGKKIANAEGQNLIARLNQRFRPVDPARIPSNVPLPCLLKGKKDQGYVSSPAFLRRSTVYLWIDGTDVVHLVKPSAIAAYLQRRQSWEDYDLCLFDDTCEWCVGITHNEDVIIAEQPLR
jgi:hypothetical protein